ncbi:MAG: efflux RND transporter periplasmic adaptor subunit [Myxococcaceae bacterium]|nr:efflux RND transporter periplasmic adaptor subunit [Myxococcaceae bacterium]
MKRFHVTFLAALLVVAACKRGEGPHEEAGHAHEEEAGSHPEARDEPDDALVRIVPEMLRDLRVTQAPVEVRRGGEAVTVLGELAVDERTYAEVAPPLPARVSGVLAAPGERVKKGQPLVELQSAELGKARAELQAALAHAEAARAAAERKRTLAAERIVAQREVQAAEAEASSAEADVAAARAALTALGAEGDGKANEQGPRLTLRSPVEGTVLERNAVMGQMAEPSRALFRVGELSRLWLIVHAFERDAVRIQPESEARVVFTAFPGQDFSARVTFVGQQVDAASRTIPVRLELANPDGLLRPGMSATAFIPLGEMGARIITVPAAALQRLEDGWFVFIPQGAGVFERRAVGRGRTLGGEVEVLSGLRPGEQVVVDGAFLLKAEVEKSHGGGGHHEH